jgi:hypothetical protein
MVIQSMGLLNHFATELQPDAQVYCPALMIAEIDFDSLDPSHNPSQAYSW